jgi:hypothetical protein
MTSLSKPSALPAQRLPGGTTLELRSRSVLDARTSMPNACTASRIAMAQRIAR